MIDICDFAVGLSRQLHGLTIASEPNKGTTVTVNLPPARTLARPAATSF
jgi:hypothetical protein